MKILGKNRLELYVAIVLLLIALGASRMFGMHRPAIPISFLITSACLTVAIFCLVNALRDPALLTGERFLAIALISISGGAFGLMVLEAVLEAF